MENHSNQYYSKKRHITHPVKLTDYQPNYIQPVLSEVDKTLVTPQTSIKLQENLLNRKASNDI